MKVLKMAAFASVVFLLASCCSCRNNKSRAAAQSLTGTEWKLVEMDGRQFTAGNSEGYFINLGTDGRISGMGDCNRIMGGYELMGQSSINLKQMASTRAFCLNQEQEDKFVKYLQDADTYRIDGNLLMMFNNGELRMVFEAQ